MVNWRWNLDNYRNVKFLHKSFTVCNIGNTFRGVDKIPRNFGMIRSPISKALLQNTASISNVFFNYHHNYKFFFTTWLFHHFLFPLDDDKVGTLDAILSTAFCRTQMYLSKQMAQLRPEITMPMFSGKFNWFFFHFRLFRH